jgi:hypothetical protein
MMEQLECGDQKDVHRRRELCALAWRTGITVCLTSVYDWHAELTLARRILQKLHTQEALLYARSYPYLEAALRELGYQTDTETELRARKNYEATGTLFSWQVFSFVYRNNLDFQRQVRAQWKFIRHYTFQLEQLYLSAHSHITPSRTSEEASQVQDSILDFDPALFAGFDSLLPAPDRERADVAFRDGTETLGDSVSQ